MKKLLIATHGYLADGFKSSLAILTGMQDQVEYIDAYVDESDYTPRIEAFVDSVGPDDQGVIFTDIYGGSVCQKVALVLTEHPKGNVFHVSGINLGLVIEVLLDDEIVTDQYLDGVVAQAREAMCVVRPEVRESVDAPSDDFFD